MAAKPDGTLARLTTQGLRVEEWSNGPGEEYTAHAHPYGKLLSVRDGSIRFCLLNGAKPGARALAPGEWLRVPPGTRHSAVVGPAGVQCVEVHVPPERWAQVSRMIPEPSGSPAADSAA